MKNTVLFFVMAALCGPVWGQQLGEHNLDTMPQVKYIRVAIGNQKLVGTPVYVAFIDFGQDISTKTGHFLHDANGKFVEFVSEMGGVNYIANKGWRLTATMEVFNPAFKKNETRWVFERKE